MHGIIFATGFEPWGSHIRNTSWDCLQLAKPSLPIDYELKRVRLPVAWDAVAPVVERIARTAPAAILAFGQYEGDRIRLECRARADFASDKLDAVGQPCPRSRLVEDDLALDSRLPLERICKALEAAQIPCQLSNDAGDFLCGYLFHRLLAYRVWRETKIPVGFVHVPTESGMNDGQIARAMEICIQAIVPGA